MVVECESGGGVWEGGDVVFFSNSLPYVFGKFSFSPQSMLWLCFLVNSLYEMLVIFY